MRWPHLAKGIEAAKLDKKTGSSIAWQVFDGAILQCWKTSSYIVHNVLSSFVKMTLCLQYNSTTHFHIKLDIHVWWQCFYWSNISR